MELIESKKIITIRIGNIFIEDKYKIVLTLLYNDQITSFLTSDGTSLRSKKPKFYGIKKLSSLGTRGRHIWVQEGATFG
jgi:hypothetical protein